MRRPRSAAAGHGGPRIFIFDMAVETHPLLAYRGGEVAELIADGLFALDREGRLFPETLPHLRDGGRLLHVRADAVGFGRNRGGLTVSQAYDVLMGSQERQDEDRTERPSHKATIDRPLLRLSRAILRLRTLEARGRAASDELNDLRTPRRGQFVELKELAEHIDRIAAAIEEMIGRPAGKEVRGA